MKSPEELNPVEKKILSIFYIFSQIENGDEEMAKAFNEYLDELDARSSNPCANCQNREN